MLDTVERELIAPSRLPEEQQSVLWLYAWALPRRPALHPPAPGAGGVNYVLIACKAAGLARLYQTTAMRSE